MEICCFWRPVALLYRDRYWSKTAVFSIQTAKQSTYSGLEWFCANLRFSGIFWNSWNSTGISLEFLWNFFNFDCFEHVGYVSNSICAAEQEFLFRFGKFQISWNFLEFLELPVEFLKITQSKHLRGQICLIWGTESDFTSRIGKFQIAIIYGYLVFLLSKIRDFKILLMKT